MIIQQELNQNILVKNFSYANKHFLIISTILYSDIKNSELYNSNILWNDIKDFIRMEQPLDEGYAKKNAELVIYGNCYSKEKVKVKEVGFRLHKENFILEKQLDVIGDRILSRNIFGKESISKPKEFKKLKVSYTNAYGGEKCEKNPIGKGFKENLSINSSLALHNIDKKEDLVLSYKNKNCVTHSFEPLSMYWSERLKKLGTYDEYWQRNHWPYFAEDIDFEVFNTVPRDQRIKGFFKGDENFEIYNMHPKIENLSGALPKKIVKTFVIKKEKNDEVFIELKTNIDTLIILPELERTAFVSRAMIEVNDDEYTEIENIFCVTEDLDSEEKDIEYYKKLQIERLEDPLSIKKKIDDSFSTDNIIDLKDISLMAEISLRTHLHESPKIFLSSSGLKSVQDKYRSMITKYLENDKLKRTTINSLNSIKKLTDHNIYSNSIDKHFEELLGGKNEDINKKIALFRKKYPDIACENILKEQVEKIKNSKELQKIKEDGFDSFLIKNWSDAARFFLADKNEILKKNPEFHNKFKKFGLREITINHILYIGLNEEKVVIDKKGWIDNSEKIDIDKGYVIGFFKGAEVKKIVIRKEIFDKYGKYLGDKSDVKIKGSIDEQIVLKGKKEEYIIVVDEILQAYLLFQDFWHICTIVVMKNKEEFEESEYFLSNKNKLKLIITTKFDLEYKDIKTHNLEVKENIYEEYLKKRDLESEIIENIPELNFKEKIKQEQRRKKRQGDAYVLPVDLKDQDNRLKKHILGDFSKNIENSLSDLSMDDKNHLLNKMKEVDESVNNMRIDKVDNIFEKVDDILRDMYRQNPNESIKKAISKVTAKLQDFKSNKKNAIPKSFSNRTSKSFNTSNSLKEYSKNNSVLENSVFQFDEISNFKFFNTNFNNSRWEEIHFENIDFINCSFKKSMFSNSTFKNCTFKNLEMDNLSISSSEFSQCTFKNTNLDNLVFTGSELAESIFESVSLSFTAFSNSDFLDCDFLSINLKESIFDKITMVNCQFSESKMLKNIYTSIDIQNSIINNCDILKSTLLKSSILNCDLSKNNLENNCSNKSNWKDVSFHTSLLNNSTYQFNSFENVDFSQAFLENSILYDCKFIKCDLRYLSAKYTSLKKSEIYSCSIKRLNLFKGDLNKTHFIDSNLTDSNLFQCNIFNTKFKNSIFIECNLERTNLFNKERYINET